MKLSKEEILKIANLANLSLTEKEVANFKGELADILEFVSQLQEAETKVRSSLSKDDLKNVLRKDEIKECDKDIRDKTLAQSPYYKDGDIKVKRILN